MTDYPNSEISVAQSSPPHRREKNERSVLHILCGRELKGGTCAFVANLATLPADSIRHLVWTHRECDIGRHPAPLNFIRIGRAAHAGRNLTEDLRGGIADVIPLIRWLKKHPNTTLHAHTRPGIFAACLAHWVTGAPLVIHFHFWANRHRIYRWLLRLTGAKAVHNSRATCIHYGDHPSTANIVMPPIPWPSKPKAEPTKNDPRLVAAGGFVRWKNPHLIVQAFNRLARDNPSPKLVIYGVMESPWDENYQAEVLQAAAGHPHIHLKDYDPEWLSRLSPDDIFVHAAQGEPFGIVILEAFAKGCRLIVPQGTFLDDLPAPCNTAGIFRLNDLTEEELVRQIRRAQIEPPPQENLWILRKQVSHLFSLENTGKQLDQIYRSL